MAWIAMLLAIAMQPSPPSPIVVIAKESMSRVDEPRQAVARTADEWAALWRQHAGDTKPPAVDFGTRTVVAVFLGTRTTGGYAVDIVNTREAGGALVVQWQERRPARDVITAQVITTPAVIASIPKFAGEIRFEKVDK
jgi:hypothetical protein